MDYAAVLPSPFPGGWRLGIVEAHESLIAIDYLPPEVPARLPDTSLAREAAVQLGRYFVTPDFRFDLPLAPAGTAHQQRVWSALCAIASGGTRRYGELADQLGSSAQAVGNACRANPIPIVIPCHRVVAAAGPGGYMGQREGAAVAIKQWLLAHERG
jgi:methylated-DNA-[protein]-cysteine S-methyltransferase